MIDNSAARILSSAPSSAPGDVTRYNLPSRRMRLTLLALACVALVACGARSGLSEPLSAPTHGDAGVITPPSPERQIALGSSYGCAILEDRGVSCWGPVEPGGARPDQLPPRRIAGLSDVLRLSVGWFAACAVRQDGTVWCWGQPVVSCAIAQDRTLADGTPRQVVEIENALDVKTSGHQTCVLRRDGTVWCWGDNAYKAVGRPPELSEPPDHPCYHYPYQVAGVTDAVAIALSSVHSCALRQDGAVLCWGRTGSRFAPDSPTPKIYDSMGQIRVIAAAQGATLAIREDGQVFTWGDNDNQILGLDAASEFVASPTLVSGLSATRAAGTYHTLCMVLDSAQVACSGVNYTGQRGVLDTAPGPRFTPVPGVSNAEDVAVGTWEVCARLSGDQFVCWGQGADTEIRGPTAFDPAPR